MLSLTRNLGSGLIVPVIRMGAIQGAAPISTSAAYFAGHSENCFVGDYPKTKEERERAAKKYNLIPEDYEPYDEGEAFGDYPKLKAIGAYNRDPYDDYDDPADMRFYGEVFHKDADLYYWERIDPLEDEKPHIPMWRGLIYTLLAISFFPTLRYLSEEYKLNINHPMKKRKYHPPDTKYYEFPSSGSGHH